jgi:glutathione reductase (NADPH)
VAFKRTFTDPVPIRQEQHYAEQGIDALHGIACFTGSDTVARLQTENSRHALS